MATPVTTAERQAVIARAKAANGGKMPTTAAINATVAKNRLAASPKAATPKAATPKRSPVRKTGDRELRFFGKRGHPVLVPVGSQAHRTQEDALVANKPPAKKRPTPRK